MKLDLLFAAVFAALGFGAGWSAGQGRGVDLCLATHTQGEARALDALDGCRAEQRADAVVWERCGEVAGRADAQVRLLARTRGRR